MYATWSMVLVVVTDQRDAVAGLHAQQNQALREVAHGLPVLTPTGRNPAAIRAHLEQRLAFRPLERQSRDLSW